LPNRRLAETFDLEVGGLRYIASIGRFADGAVVASIALRYGVPLEVIRHALMRNRDGSACGPLGAALDLLHEREAER
jgi:hypothetical protein